MPESFEIICEEGQSTYHVVLTASHPKVFEYANKNREIVGKTGEELVAAIVAAGHISGIERYKNGAYNDGVNGEPAIEKFNIRGKPVFQAHFKDGKAAIIKEFNDNGRLTQIAYLKDGKLHDPESGLAAVQKFTGSGEMLHMAHYRNGKCNDSPAGDPAFHGFNASGDLVRVERWANDKVIKKFTDEEISVYAAEIDRKLIEAYYAEPAGESAEQKPSQQSSFLPTENTKIRDLYRKRGGLSNISNP